MPLGFETGGRVAADLSLAPDTLPAARLARRSFTHRSDAEDRVRQRVSSSGCSGSPGVRAAAASFTSPLTGAPNRGISIEGRPPRHRAGGHRGLSAGHAGLLPRRRRHRWFADARFTDTDRANTPHVAVVNQAFVDAYLPGDEPDRPAGAVWRARGSHEIVGVVADMRYRLVESPADPTFYMPITQNAERWPFLSFTVWSDGDRRRRQSRLAARRSARPTRHRR